MNAFFASVLEHYHWQLSLYAGVGIAAVTFLGKKLLALVPAVKEATQINGDTYRGKMERPAYAAIQKSNSIWGAIYLIVIFAVVLPFCLTLEPQPWWKMPLDIVAILFLYDFLYYFTHRFLFHDNGFLGGPLLWMHAVHHRQHNPCRGDSSYLNPLESAIGLGLYLASILILSRLMGNFHVATIVITWVAFQEINLHNHDLWKTDRFPFKYLNYASRMHHNHHARFTAGNYATISLLFDWLFGTLDNGEGYKKESNA